MSKYRIKDPNNSVDFEDLARISFNLRYYSKIWKENYGSENRILMVYWENQLDTWLKSHIKLVKDDVLTENSNAWHNKIYNTPHPKRLDL